MFKIGDFSRLSRVSVKMLRHYDELGLLKPAWVDPSSDYRYYAAEQLPRLNRLIALKDLGFTLEQVRQLLDEDVPLEQLRGMLRLRRAEIAQQLLAEQARLASVEARLSQIEREGGLPAYEVLVRAVPAQPMATRREVVPSAQRIEQLFDEVELYVAQFKARAASPPLTIYHDHEYREHDLDVEVAVPLSSAVPPGPRVSVGELPGSAHMACVVHTGSYAGIAQAASALFTWIAAHGYQICGPLREVYLRFGASIPLDVPAAYLTADAAAYVTELQLPVEKA